METTEKAPLSENHANEVGQMVATQNRVTRALFLQPGFDRASFLNSLRIEVDGAKAMEPAQPLTVVILTSLVEMLEKLPVTSATR